MQKKFKTARMFSHWQTIADICALCCLLVTPKFVEVSNNAHEAVSVSGHNMSYFHFLF